jgi:hypothetical protein
MRWMGVCRPSSKGGGLRFKVASRQIRQEVGERSIGDQ